MSRTGLTPLRIRLLTAISIRPARDLTELASDVGSFRSSVSRSMAFLEKQGWVERNGRTWHITDEGRNVVLHKRAAYMRSIEPCIEKARKYAELYHIPLLVIVEVDGWLHAKTNELDACSELRCAYREAMGWDEEL